jgi:hypothetical protein
MKCEEAQKSQPIHYPPVLPNLNQNTNQFEKMWNTLKAQSGYRTTVGINPVHLIELMKNIEYMVNNGSAES